MPQNFSCHNAERLQESMRISSLLTHDKFSVVTKKRHCFIYASLQNITCFTPLMLQSPFLMSKLENVLSHWRPPAKYNAIFDVDDPKHRLESFEPEEWKRSEIGGRDEEHLWNSTKQHIEICIYAPFLFIQFLIVDHSRCQKSCCRNDDRL